MARLYTIGDGRTIVEVEGPVNEDGLVVYLERDSLGETIYSNTHFPTKAEAWGQVLANTNAGLFFAAEGVREARRRLNDAEAKLVNRALEASEAIENHAAWLRKEERRGR